MEGTFDAAPSHGAAQRITLPRARLGGKLWERRLVPGAWCSQLMQSAWSQAWHRTPRRSEDAILVVSFHVVLGPGVRRKLLCPIPRVGAAGPRPGGSLGRASAGTRVRSVRSAWPHCSRRNDFSFQGFLLWSAAPPPGLRDRTGPSSPGPLLRTGASTSSLCGGDAATHAPCSPTRQQTISDGREWALSRKGRIMSPHVLTSAPATDRRSGGGLAWL